MKFKTLGAIILTSAIGLGLIGGCSKSNDDEIALEKTYSWISKYSNHKAVYLLLKKGDYENAKSLLEQSLKEDFNEGGNLDLLLSNFYNISKETKKQIDITIKYTKEDIKDLLESD